MAGSRRTPGEGGAYIYQTRAGERWFFKCTVTLAPVGDKPPEKKVIVRRGFATKTKALAKMREVMGESEQQGGFFAPSDMTVQQLVTLWLDSSGLWPQSRKSYGNVLGFYVLPRIGKVKLSALTSSMITKALADIVARGGKRGGPLSLTTATLCKGALSSAITWGIEKHEPPLLRANPCSKAGYVG